MKINRIIEFTFPAVAVIAIQVISALLGQSVTYVEMVKVYALFLIGIELIKIRESLSKPMVSISVSGNSAKIPCSKNTICKHGCLLYGSRCLNCEREGKANG